VKRGLFAAILFPVLCHASTTAFWELTSFSDFVKGTFNGVSLGRDGRLSLARNWTRYLLPNSPSCGVS